MNKFYIPTKVLESIEDYTKVFINYNNIQISKLNKELINLWFFIYNEQRIDPDIDNLNIYKNLHSKKLTKFNVRIGKERYKYHRLLLMLEECKVININNIFSQNKFTKSYRVDTNCIKDNFTMVEVDFDKIFYNYRTKEYWLDIYPHMKKQIDECYHTKVDLSKYINWLETNRGMKLKPKFKKGILEERYLTNERILDYINSSLKINYNNYWFKISDEGRFYNSLTNLSSTAMPFIKLNRRKLKEIDIVNCQPLLLSLLVSNRKYKKDVLNGCFYENLSKIIGKNRNDTKMLSFRYIFFSKKELKSGDIYDGLEKLYPGLIEEINELKSRIDISRELQRIEASIFIGKLSFINIDMMLRHDAVFVAKEDYKLVKRLVRELFKSELGLEPQI